MTDLMGTTIFITGASRGHGEAATGLPGRDGRGQRSSPRKTRSPIPISRAPSSPPLQEMGRPRAAKALPVQADVRDVSR